MYSRYLIEKCFGKINVPMQIILIILIKLFIIIIIIPNLFSQSITELFGVY